MNKSVLRSFAAACAVGVALTSCSSSDDDAAGTTTEAVAGFPVTIEHKFGETTFDAPAERVVTVGYNELDFVLSLGVKPAATRAPLSFDAFQSRPWAQEAQGGEEIPEVGSESVDTEAVAAADPDAILGPYSYMEQGEYDLYTGIAPTLADLKAADGGAVGTWQEELTAIAEVLGKTEEAATVQAEVESKFADAIAAAPQMKGRTAAVVLYSPDGSFYILEADDLRTRFFTELGFGTPPTTGAISAEQANLLDQDNLILLGADRATAAQNPLLANLNVVKEDRTVYFGDFNELVPAALGFSSPLSIAYTIDASAAALSAATDDDPTTAVPAITAP